MWTTSIEPDARNQGLTAPREAHGQQRELPRVANPPAAVGALSGSERKALAITSTFETGEPFGFGGLTGDFDDQGISFGLLQWNFGSGSLIALLAAFASEAPQRFDAVFGPHAASFRALVLDRAKDAGARQLAFAKSISRRVGKKHRVVEPWQTYFTRLGAEPFFQQIQVRFARRALDRAAEWCRKLALKSERAYVFMLDTVAAHGFWWLDAPKFKGARIRALDAGLTLKRFMAGGRELTDREKLEVIAGVLANASKEHFREAVRARKMWFVTGRGEIHGTEYDLQRDFGVTDAPFTTSAKAVAAPARPSVPHNTGAGGASALSPQLEETIVTPVVLARLAAGERDPSRLASEAFYALHPERKRRPIAREERALAEQWRRLRAGVVARLLRPWIGVPTGAQAAGKIAGSTRYVALALGSEAPAAPRTGIFFPSRFRAEAAIDLILYLHGHKTTSHYPDGPEMQIDGYWSESTKPRVPLREAVEQSGKNVVLVAPTLGPRSQPGTLADPGGLDAYLRAVLEAIAGSGPFQGRPAPSLRHLILAAHSGGGAAMRKLAAGRDTALARLRECWGYDCFYDPQADEKVWLAWAKAHPGQRLFAYHATDACCSKVKPCPKWGCGPNGIAATLAQRAKGLGLLNLRMLPTKGNHFSTVQDHFEERVRAASFLAAR